LYNENGKYTTDENRLIIDANEFYLEDVEFSKDGWPIFASSMEYTSEMRGRRHVRT
jgi:hypothetical protein